MGRADASQAEDVVRLLNVIACVYVNIGRGAIYEQSIFPRGKKCVSTKEKCLKLVFALIDEDVMKFVQLFTSPSLSLSRFLTLSFSHPLRRTGAILEHKVNARRCCGICLAFRDSRVPPQKVRELLQPSSRLNECFASKLRVVRIMFTRSGFPFFFSFARLKGESAINQNGKFSTNGL